MFEMTSPAEWLNQGFGWSLALAYVGGLAIALTPCVYPLIPITLGVMGAQKTKTRWGAFGLSLLFVLGISLVYTVLGVLAASTGKVAGSWGQHPAVVGSISLLFLVLGLGMLGLFNLTLPSSFMTWLSKRGGQGPWGVIGMGMASGVLAAPCSGPVSIGILAVVAQGGNLLWGFWILFAYSLGMGTPFLLLGTFSQLLTRIPKSGVWLHWVKRLCGVAMILAAFFFAKPLWVGLWPPEPHSPTVSGDTSESLWIYSETDALRLAREQDKPVLVDFWAAWCEACNELDKETYSNPKVEAWLRQHYIRLKLDVSDMTGENSQRLLEKYGVLGMPTVLFLRPSGYIEKSLTFVGFVPPEEFLKHLQKAQKTGLHP